MSLRYTGHGTRPMSSSFGPWHYDELRPEKIAMFDELVTGNKELADATLSRAEYHKLLYFF